MLYSYQAIMGIGIALHRYGYGTYIITESVDSVCRDTTYTQYMPIQKNLSKSQKWYTYITTYRSSSSVFMTNKTPRIAKNHRESTSPGNLAQRRLNLSRWFSHETAAFSTEQCNRSSLPPSLHQAAAAAHSITMASFVTPFSRLYACALKRSLSNDT